MFLPHFDLFCDLLLNRRTATWNLFVLYNKTNYYTKRLFISKYCSYTKRSNLTGCYAQQRIVIGREKSRHCQTWLECRSSLNNENLHRKQNWTAKSTNLEENAGKIKSVFVIGAALWAEKFGRWLENYRSWKNTIGKLVVTVNLEAIWFEFWMKRA